MAHFWQCEQSKATRGATLRKSGVVTFRVTSVNGGVITHKGALNFLSSAGFVTLQNIALNYTTGQATDSVEATVAPTGMKITDLLTLTGGTNRIRRNGSWRKRQRGPRDEHLRGQSRPAVRIAAGPSGRFDRLGDDDRESPGHASVQLAEGLAHRGV